MAAAFASIAALVFVLVKLTVRRSARKILYMAINAGLILVGVAWCALGGWDASTLSTSEAFCRGRGYQCEYTLFYSPPAVDFLVGLVLILLAPLMFFYWRKNDYKRDRILVHRGGGDAKSAGMEVLPGVSMDDLQDLPL